ncbi:hypothetical protein KP509_33G018100 [Ceratopteris richardii]|uniref:Reverse transcriptase domain-containing protein n=1 Tax=Ceratopteris richardii TaxID=49495 RepID=A0A8T2QPJ1_CERRI|nr:hypothetical protein KP509_33G018100 [Ceratopteris richardii]
MHPAPPVTPVKLNVYKRREGEGMSKETPAGREGEVGKRVVDSEGFTPVTYKKALLRGKQSKFQSGYSTSPTDVANFAPDTNDNEYYENIDILATWNIQGLGQYGKWTRLWRWIVRHQLNVMAIQEHKKHDHARMLLYTKDFQLRYNSSKSNYSGCLFIVRKDIQFKVMLDDPQGRFIAIHLMKQDVSFICINVYAPNTPAERVRTWNLLVQYIHEYMHLEVWRDSHVLLCGDFNMVDSEDDCTTMSSLISLQEKEIWKKLLDTLNCKDLWDLIGGHTLRYTFHSRSHKTAMSRLDRCYYSHAYALDAASTMWIDATMLLSYHNPLLINLQDIHWESNIPNNLARIPPRLNHAWLQTSLFKSKVDLLIQWISSWNVSACMKWEALVVSMQGVIRDCGKYFTVTLTKAKVEAERMILLMTEKVDYGQCLQLIENNAIQSSKVRARCMEVNDLHANSKCFLDLLRVKRLRGTITMLETDGLTLRDNNSIAAMCTQHYQNLFASAHRTDDAWFSSLQDSLAFTPHALDSHMAVTCEKCITVEEVFLAIRSLKNGKAPGMDGLTKEFVIVFWPSLKTLILDVCNEIWRDQKMPYSFKLGKIKLIPKLEVPKQMGDWRPITLMSIMYKIFANIFSLRLKPIMHRIVHPTQHATSSKQEIVGMQIDFEKTFDRIRWDFIAIVLKKLGFGVKFCRLIYILAQDSASHVEINGRLSDPFPVERSIRQGCPRSPFLYALASSPMFTCWKLK